jgi:hypothetical protein
MMQSEDENNRQEFKALESKLRKQSLGRDVPDRDALMFRCGRAAEAAAREAASEAASNAARGRRWPQRLALAASWVMMLAGGVAIGHRTGRIQGELFAVAVAPVPSQAAPVTVAEADERRGGAVIDGAVVGGSGNGGAERGVAVPSPVPGEAPWDLEHSRLLVARMRELPPEPTRQSEAEGGLEHSPATIWRMGMQAGQLGL